MVVSGQIIVLRKKHGALIIFYAGGMPLSIANNKFNDKIRLWE